MNKNDPVLVVDDQEHVLASVSDWLCKAGWTSICVQSHMEAIWVAGHHSLAAAIVDYRLALRGVGIRLGQSLLRDYHVPFILISGYLTTAVVVEAVKSGASDVIDKPLSAGRLLAALERAVADAFRWNTTSDLSTSD